MKKKICLLIAICTIFSVTGTVFATAARLTDIDANSSAEVKVYANATLEDSFVDDHVLVVLSNEASLQFKSYIADDFAEISCINVEDMSQASGNEIKSQVELRTLSTSAQTNELYSVDTDKIEKYNQVLSLTISEPGKQNVLDAIDVLMQREDVIYAGPDYIYTVEIQETSARVADLNGTPLAAQLIQLSEAWNITTGSDSVMVGVLDSGIDATHPDLVNQVNVTLSGDFSGETPVLGVSTYSDQHGTHVAGIIAGEGNNSYGAAGVCKNITLVSLKVMRGLVLEASSLQRAIEYAGEVGIQILNLSAMLSSNSDVYDYALFSTIENYPGLLVCAAGNSNSDNDENPIFPSNFVLDNLISVGASDSLDQRWENSHYGQNTVDIFAPGVNIMSTLPNGSYGKMSGTSMAAPYVTGVAALMLSVCPDLTPLEIKTRIMAYADEVTALQTYCVSGARLNAYRPLLYAHTLEYAAQDVWLHLVHCGCGLEYTEAHSWVEFGTKFSCDLCGFITTAIPEVVQKRNQEPVTAAATAFEYVDVT